MALDPGTRMHSGVELEAAMDAHQAAGGAIAASTLTASSTVTLSPASKNVAISPTGTGTVTISPVGALTMNPTAASALDNTVIGAGTPLAGSFTNMNATGYMRGSVGNALTAIGADRAGSLALSKQVNNVTTAAASTGVTLPAVSSVGVGGIVTLFNGGANAIQVYGAGSDTIDGAAAATGVPLTNGKRALFVAVAAATYISAQLGVVSA